MKLLLDEHISDAVAKGFARQNRSVAIKTVVDLGIKGASDHELLAECKRQGFILVTFDLATIPPLLQEWAKTGRSHCGVILADQGTISASDFGGLIEALLFIVAQTRGESWTDRVLYLRKPNQ